jgi:hypothetical protein
MTFVNINLMLVITLLMIFLFFNYQHHSCLRNTILNINFYQSGVFHQLQEVNELKQS